MNRMKLAFALLGAMAIAPTALAQQSDQNRFAVVGGYALSEPTGDARIAGAEGKLDGERAPPVSATWYATDSIAIEPWGGDKFGRRANGANGKAGSSDAQAYPL